MFGLVWVGSVWYTMDGVEQWFVSFFRILFFVFNFLFFSTSLYFYFTLLYLLGFLSFVGGRFTYTILFIYSYRYISSCF